MSQFPKAPRFPPQKPSEVPGPSLFELEPHGPHSDPWRKGPLEIFKASRPELASTKVPDTFGLYNASSDCEAPKIRTRAISTHATTTPSAHHAELLRYESRLFQYESQIESLQRNLQNSESVLKETRRALQRSESAVSELDRAKAQIAGLSGIQRKLAELTEEHRKSKERRDAEITRLNGQLRDAEERCEQQRRTSGAGREAFERINLHLCERLPRLLAEMEAGERALAMKKQLTKIDRVRVRKRLGDRVAQVSELAGLVNEQAGQEEMLLELADTLVDVESCAREEAEDLAETLWVERERLIDELMEGRESDQLWKDVWASTLTESREETMIERARAEIAENELAGFNTRVVGLESRLSETVEAYQTLATTSHAARVEASNQLSARDSEATEANDVLRKTHAGAIEEWEREKNKLVTRAEEASKAAANEKELRRKAGAEVLVSRQAEAGARADLQQLEQVQAQLDAVEIEKAQLAKINDLLSRQSSLNAEEADKLAALNTELVSHQNPAQRLKVLDRLRREGKEERTNAAHLQNELWAARAQIESLKEELSAYQAVSVPPVPIRKKTTSSLPPKSPSQQLVGFSRVSRATLTEVTIEGAPAGSRRTGERSAAIDSLPLRSARNQKRTPQCPQSEFNNGVPHYEIFSRGRVQGSSVGAEARAAELSLGAVKMQGRMTLDELR
ncbi:hypothetical protein CROQUDRAFT_53856 [Cronartium quercuum f. sp. fusiforme G11]|uniref:Uncharacterized protein n=1 Tax=Cronartium quercuum f. sp. fusiforme G11 TaxID=708437 RepID=A0A9P6N6K0_9BASI|nr:hypothetical protein CROQUDRAFT_53856 [Cronartium quercuum f. sp. fusiforme G11]